MGKRVCCLYRVSTLGQVEKDDIPMQKQRCHEFAEQQGWEIVAEYAEKGVSGFKVSAKDRDAIQEIQRDAVMGKFDILLVFMFDRLGRREDETPFVVEWFVKNGIEVWSTVEGQQRFDSHVDKLMNYIRYWQASGESVKTSIRTKTRLSQIVQEGKYRGGACPYGYRLVKKGRIGKRNQEKYDIEINPDEAPAIRRMFELADRLGYGGRKIATLLEREGIINERSGEKFHYATIQNILKNIMYMGILKSGETRSDIFPELQIITPEQFQRVEKLRDQRGAVHKKKCQDAEEKREREDETEKIRHMPMRNEGRALLSGNAYCGHCGGRIFATTGRKTHHPGHMERIPIYKCYNRSQHKDKCDGPATYRAEKVDGVIDALLREVFQKTRAVDVQTVVDRQMKSNAEETRRRLRSAKAELDKNLRERDRLESLMLDAMDGACVFTPEQLKRRLDRLEESIQQNRNTAESLKRELEDVDAKTALLQQEHKQLSCWADLYDKATTAEKKMICGHMIRRVEISRGYGLQVEFTISEAQCLWGMEGE